MTLGALAPGGDGGRPFDLILLVDNSNSMTEEQASLVGTSCE